MQNTLKHLGPDQYNDLTHAIQKIATTSGAESIYCFGSRSTQMLRWSPFHAGPATDYNITASFYDLLLVMPESALGYETKINGLGNQPTNQCTTFYYHILSRIELINRLKNNDSFACHVCRHAALLYSNNKERLLNNSIPYPCAASANSITLHWVKGINLAHQHYRMAQRAAHRNERWQTLTQLHQSAVQTCIALITLHTGYRQQPQKLSDLLWYCNNFCLIRNRIFPCNTAEETELLQSLERTAQAAAPDQAYPIPAYIIDALLNRLKKMLELAEALYKQKTGMGRNKTASLEKYS